MKRRTAGFIALAALAAAAGGGTAWWRGHAAGGTAGETAAAPAPIDLWSLTFRDLEGAPLRMAEFRGRPLVLNFWATWCGPCVTEMPLLDQFATARAGSGWRVLALAIDQVEPVRRFATERALRLPIALAGGDGIDLSRSLGNSLGGLPFSVVFDSAGAPVDRRLGALDADVLARWVGQTR
jgi:thiol-disulfide isomerase/thioredoxin